LTIKFEDIVRTVQQVPRSELEIAYQIRVNGVLVVNESGVDGSSAPSSVRVNAGNGDLLDYNITWTHKNFGVTTATASDALTIGSGNNTISVIPTYDYQHNDDGDTHVNDAEINQGYSPLAANDSPSSPFVSLNSPKRSFVEGRDWAVPVFACRNPPNVGNNDWIWIFNTNQTLSGVEEIDGRMEEFPNRGFWGFIDNSELQIINERGEGEDWTWSLDQRSAELSLNFVTIFGECIRIAGPPL
jgi:hypothetical protein